jgi:hypothetical protein
MIDRHLLPDEIDLLLDDEVGFGVSPLKAHVRACADCSARIEEARFVADAVEHLPHFAPSHTFADRVMSQVPVFVPWHVTAMDAVRPWIPRSRSTRVVVATVAAATGSVLTLLLVWIATQTDTLTLANGIAGTKLRAVVLEAARDVLSTVLGDQIFTVIQRAGTIGIAAALIGLVVAAAGSLAGFRALASASSRRRA